MINIIINKQINLDLIYNMLKESKPATIKNKKNKVRDKREENKDERENGRSRENQRQKGGSWAKRRNGSQAKQKI